MTIAAFKAPDGLVYYLQRVNGQDGYEIRHSPGKRPRLVKRVEAKSDWRDFITAMGAR